MKNVFLKVFCTVAFLTLSVIMFADEWQDMYDTVDQLYSDGEYSSAIDKVKELVDYTKKEFGENTPEMGHTYNLCGLVSSKLDKFNDAESYFKKAIKSFEVSGEDERDNAGILNGNLGDLYYLNDEYELALTYLEKAIEIMEDENSSGNLDDNLEIPYYDAYKIYEKDEKYSSAVSVLKKLIDIEKVNYGATDTLVGIDLKNLAWLYIYLGNYDDAETYMQKAQTVLEKNPGTKKQILGILYNDYGVLYDYQEKYSSAKPLYKKAIEIFTDANNDVELANSYNNLGLAHYKLEEYYTSEGYFQKSYDIYMELYGEDDENTISVKSNLDAAKSYQE